MPPEYNRFQQYMIFLANWLVLWQYHLFVLGFVRLFLKKDYFDYKIVLDKYHLAWGTRESLCRRKTLLLCQQKTKFSSGRSTLWQSVGY